MFFSQLLFLLITFIRQIKKKTLSHFEPFVDACAVSNPANERVAFFGLFGIKAFNTEWIVNQQLSCNRESHLLAAVKSLELNGSV
jgi:hypothetical protein